MKSARRVNLDEQSFWQLVFSQSKVNGAPYEGEKFIPARWHWPTDTYLQRRRQYLKSSQSLDPSGSELGGGVYDSLFDQPESGRRAFGSSTGSLRSS